MNFHIVNDEREDVGNFTSDVNKFFEMSRFLALFQIKSHKCLISGLYSNSTFLNPKVEIFLPNPLQA